jgi:uncharacterized protein (UPF0128 family)
MKNRAARAIVINDVAAILLLDFFSKKCVKELVATVNSIDTSIAFRKGLNSSTIKKIITIAIAIIK